MYGTLPQRPTYGTPHPPPAQEPTTQTSRPPQAIPQPPAAPLQRQVLLPRAAVVGSADTLWDRLGTTNQDRASVVLIGAGVLVVVFAALAQLRLG
jgi:hypothetical protein